MSPPDTRDQILDVAEAMLAADGFAGLSLRRLTTAAGVNLAAVNYHFGGKEELVKAVLARRIAPINSERLSRLEALEALAAPDGDEPAELEAILRAFLEPPLRATATGCDPGTGRQVCRMFGRILVEQPPFLRDFLRSQFGSTARRFVDALARVLPREPVATIWWRLHFVVGAMAHAIQNATAVQHMSDGLCDPDDADALVEELVAFATAGFLAPLSADLGRGRQR
ncbi:MAG: TetR family transcriptional regulator [Planctomycetes bacterium]|nr:TetR family transcriptional regulator [Planctomycetota bacterium]